MSVALDPTRSPDGSLPVSRGARIGERLVNRGLMTLEQAGNTAKHALEQNVRFGEAAVALGFVRQEDVDLVLALQRSMPALSAPATVSQDVFSFVDPEGQSTEDIRALRNALTLRWFQHAEGGRTLAVIGPDRGDGRSLTAANLAVSFAQVGVRTLLIDADMRHPRQHLLFGLDNTKGLSGYLNGRPEDTAYYYVAGLETLTVIPVGKLPPSPQELLLRPTLNSLIEAVSLNFDAVIIDTPAACAGTDYQILATASRGALFVGRKRLTRTADSNRIIETCGELGVRIVGGVLSEPVKAKASRWRWPFKA